MKPNDRSHFGDHRISIVHFTNSTLWGGVEGHICGLLRDLSRKLFRAQLVCDPVLYGRFREAIPDNIPVTPLSLSNPRQVGAALRFAGLLATEQPEVVHSHMFWGGLFAHPIAAACRVSVRIETLHGTEAWRTGWKANRAVDRALVPLVSRFVAVCGSDARFLMDKKRVPADKVSIIHNGVDIRRFEASQEARRRIRHSLGISEHDLVLIVVARFHTGKGHPVLFDAVHQLAGSHPKLKLICLGEGEREFELRAICKKLDLMNRVRFVGYRQNVPEWLAAADINVLPTFYEGFPLTVLEAMASGLPTVASNVGGIPEAIENGVSGLLVPPEDSHSLANTLALLSGDPARRLEIGHAARERVQEKFSLDGQVRATEKMYLELCGHARGEKHNTTPTSPLDVPEISCVAGGSSKSAGRRK